MSYLAFALKYRPQTFDEVIGQNHVVVSLRNAILKGRVHHAYLFSGPRGVGKTSLARILARSLNCSTGPTPSPCGKCTSCLEITQGKSLDIIEIDAASNRGIDEIRTLRENVKLSPVHSRYKVYIIDEVHMLTQEAFNALLKTLEEPPVHVKFIFATTHPHKVPPTILSRCQKFQFSLIPLEEIVTKLKHIVNSEKVKIKDNLLYTIGRAGAGSIRDAESLLDQLVPVILEKGALSDIFSFLGVIEEDSLNKMLKFLLDKDLNSCLDFIEKQVKEGKDLGVFLSAFIEHLRNLLLAKISVKNFKELSDISPESKTFISGLTAGIETADILKIIDLLIEAKELSQRLNTVRIPLELALVKYTYQPQASGLASKEAASKFKSKETNNPHRDTHPVDAHDFDIDIADITPDKKKPPLEAKSLKEDEAEDNLEQDNVLSQILHTRWPEVISCIQRTRAALASHLSCAEPVASAGSLVKIGFAPADSFHKEVVENPRNLDFIKEIISKLMEKPIGIKLISQDLPGRASRKVSSSGPSDNPGSGKKKEAVDRSALGDEDFLNDLLDTFDGKFHNE